MLKGHIALTVRVISVLMALAEVVIGLPNAHGAGVCAQVRIRVTQDIVMTRTAFRAILELDNGSDTSITKFGDSHRICP